MAKKTYDSIVAELLNVVPEIEEDYAMMGHYELSEKDIHELETIGKMHNLPRSDNTKPGATIVFEDLLIPLIVSLSTQASKAHRLREIMNWIEELANDEDFHIRNLVAVSVCEPLLTTHQKKSTYIYPYMGNKTKDLCRMQLSQYKLTDKTVQLFQER